MDVAFPISFTKMSGTGNDFIVIDHRIPVISPADQPEFARRVCRRMFSVGADGLILIESSAVADFSWRFYNADGSMPEMCGNGSRCAARFAFRHGIAGKRMRFETIAGIIEAEITKSAEIVSIRMTNPGDIRLQQQIDLGGERFEVSHINTGVPVAVIFLDREDIPVKEWGPVVRYHSLFQPAGANADFVRIIGKHEIHVRTYERGVEDETMACGTGAVAAAIMAAMQKGVSSPVQVTTSGGEKLTITFDIKQGPVVENVFLQGPARIIYTGNLTAESLL
jgi:diaminopimelate epimerase